MPFQNRIRLNFYLTRPQFPDEKTVFKLADGSRRIQSITISKQYEGVTDLFPEWVHEKFKIALSHDHVNIEGDRYFGGVVIDGDYDIAWIEFMDYPYGPAKFKVDVNPFLATNSNCQTCEEANQLNLVDDSMPDTIEQSTEYMISVLDNDSITCSPITVELVYTNSVFIETAEISELGVITFTTKALFFVRNTVTLFTYRVTCPSGSYDEANVLANAMGDEEACLLPTNLVISDIDYNFVTLTWDDPTPAPADGYEWKIVEADSPEVIIDSGTTASVGITITDLNPAEDYIFSIRGRCDVDAEDFSEWGNLTLTTLVVGETCGRYKLEYFNSGGTGLQKDVTYIGCNNKQKTVKMFAFHSHTVCALQTLPGVPVSIIGADAITYLRPC